MLIKLISLTATLAAVTSVSGSPAAPPDEPSPARVAPADEPGGPEAAASQDRLLDTIRSLPTKRSAWGDDEHRKGLRATAEPLLGGATSRGHYTAPALI